jgi:ribosomal protein S17E
VEKYYSKLGLDFHSNKRVVDDAATVPSKRMRNKIAGFTTVRMSLLMWRILVILWEFSSAHC